jgi:ethanolamine utilization protein EutS
MAADNLMRIIQETVPGRQITLAHIIANPKPIIHKKLGLNPSIDYTHTAIGVLTMTPAEMAIIGSDLATKAADIDLSFLDRFSGTLIFTGTVSNVETALKAIVNYAKETLGFAICNITRS